MDGVRVLFRRIDFGRTTLHSKFAGDGILDKKMRSRPLHLLGPDYGLGLVRQCNEALKLAKTGQRCS